MSKTIEEWSEERRLQLITNYNQLGLRASGNWALSLNPIIQKEVFKVRVKMQAAGYSQQMIVGRKSNANQDDEAIKKWVGWAGSTFLKQWVKDKGLSISPFAVAYSIARNGIKVPNQHNTGELMEGVITNETVGELIEIVGGRLLADLQTDIRGIVKTVL